MALVVGVVVAACPAYAMTNDVLPSFRGTWVPAAAAGISPLEVRIGAQAVTFQNGAQRVEFGKLEQCFSCMRRDVQNVTLLSTDSHGGQPEDAHAGRQEEGSRGAVDISDDRKLAARFPFARDGALRKCP